MIAHRSLALTDWDAVGHDLGAAWLDFAGRFGVVLLLAVGAAFVVLAVRRRKHYRAVDVMDDASRERVHAAVRAAEERTVGEILPVVVERSDRHPGARWVAGLCTALLGCALLAPWLPWSMPLALVLCQLVLGALGFGLAVALPDFQRRFVAERRADEMAGEQAVLEFFRNGLHETEARTGVLIFVSLLEHRVLVLGDTGIDAKLQPADWEAARDAVLEGVRAGNLAGGLCEGIRLAGERLAEHFPWRDGDRNELPDRVIVRAE